MDDNIEDQCRRGVRRTLAKFDWQLVQDEDAFGADVLAEVHLRLPKTRNRTLDQVIHDATVNRYGHIWHAACKAEGTPIQDRALTELFTYLYRVALARTENDEALAIECAQDALIKVWQKHGQVRDVGAFMSWVRQIVTRLIGKRLTRGLRRVIDPETEESIWQPREIALSDLHLQSDRYDGTIDNAPPMTEATRTRLTSAIRDCLRSPQQQEAVIQCFIENKSHIEVALALKTTPQNLSVLKSKALSRLRGCKEFVDALEELL